MSTNLNALFSAMNRGDVFAIKDQLFPRTAVSSAIPSSEVAGPGRHSLRETGPEVLGGGNPPVTGCGPATVGDFSETSMGDNGFSEFAKKDSPFRQFVADTMLPAFAPSKPQDVRSMAELHLGKPIVTTHVCPPIPCRKHDWCAYPAGEEEDGAYGWGRTESEAIADLIQLLRDDERIPETL